ncbi:uncharacterized protein STEHIDRAFT_160801 [Stereum hirsutum FP-91666 SS1]|uniref:uncharacterized protein n=1 Tax=Stereum hirsutum (strain FP-91666) TaxID=721885 RepID=UPI000444962D|nr:uncharacterized protein STEHIDRAFT_160801 [Stereum hirsutum FP-91666 SS1]EIM82246.1 hypothetical protein STEHIDRAFT_160801 [Stereum hirsutum FP-91666 SS1]
MENTERSCGIWNEAVDKYKSETKADSLRFGSSSWGTTASAEAILTAIAGNWKDFKDSRTKRKCHLLDVVRPVVKIAGNRKDFEDSRVKRKCLIDALRPVVEVVQLMAEVAGEGASLTFAPGKTIFVAIRILLKASNKVRHSYDSVIDIFESLGSFLGRLTLCLEPNISSPMKEVIIKILARLLSILGVATRLIRETRAVTYFKTLIGKNSEVQAALEKLEKLAAQEGRVVVTATLSAASEILSELETRMKADQQDANAIKTMLMKIAQEAEAISGSSQESRIMLEEIREQIMNSTEKVFPYLSNRYRYKVHQWLSAPSPVSNNENNGSVREAGTGSWFLQSTEYNHWKTKSNSLLWVSGGPGSGKSVLSSTIIRDIEFDSEVDSSISLAYFYFDLRQPEKEQCLGLISSLVDQLASRCSDMPAALEWLYGIHRNGMEQPTLHNLVAALKEMIVNIACSVYIVIDALDECSERNNLMALIEEITQWNLDNIHMLLTSRKEEDLNRLLMPLSAEVTLESSIVDRDIAFHIRAVLQNDRDFSKWQPPQKLEIETRVTSGAHGMFRRVSCQLDSIRGCPNARMLAKSLATSPRTLYKTYDTILNRIDDQDFKYVQTTLQWLAFSMRPVKLEEVVEALAVDFDSVPLRFAPEYRFPEPRYILTICSSLVTLSGTGVLGLSHISVKEYLDGNITEPSIQHYSFNALIAHEFIAQACIAYLMQFTHSVDIERFPLALYAAEHWMNHAGPTHNDAVADLAFDLLQAHSMVFVNWVRIYDVDRDSNNTELSRPPDDIPPPLYYAARAGFVRVSKKLLENGADVSAQGGVYGNALQAASVGGHSAVVQQLLENGADVNAQGGRYGNALQAASVGGHNAVVQQLLEAMSTDKKKPNDEPVLEQDSKFFDGFADLWTIFVVTCSSLLPISQVRIVVEESVLDHFTYFRELREADQRADDDLMGVVRRIIEEWKTMGALLFALAALDAAVFGFSRDGTIFTVNEGSKYAIAMSSVAACVGGVVDVCFLIRYSSCDAALFQSYAKDVLKSYLFFSLSSRIPAFSVLVAVTSLAVFMCMVVYTIAPTLVIAFIIFTLIIRFGNPLFWVLYQIAYVVNLAMDWVFEKFGVIRRTVLDRISQWFQYIMHQIRP